jgi:hypothetical protein
MGDNGNNGLNAARGGKNGQIATDCPSIMDKCCADCMSTVGAARDILHLMYSVAVFDAKRAPRRPKPKRAFGVFGW